MISPSYIVWSKNTKIYLVTILFLFCIFITNCALAEIFYKVECEWHTHINVYALIAPLIMIMFVISLSPLLIDYQKYWATSLVLNLVVNIYGLLVIAQAQDCKYKILTLWTFALLTACMQSSLVPLYCVFKYVFNLSYKNNQQPLDPLEPLLHIKNPEFQRPSEPIPTESKERPQACMAVQFDNINKQYRDDMSEIGLEAGNQLHIYTNI